MTLPAAVGVMFSDAGLLPAGAASSSATSFASEVGDLHAAPAVEQEVLRLDIAVDVGEFMGMRPTRG